MLDINKGWINSLDLCIIYLKYEHYNRISKNKFENALIVVTDLCPDTVSRALLSNHV